VEKNTQIFPSKITSASSMKNQVFALVAFNEPGDTASNFPYYNSYAAVGDTVGVQGS